MKRIGKLLLVSIILVISNVAFAAKDTQINITFVDMTDRSGNATTIDAMSGTLQLGPVIERNGGQALMSISVEDGDGFQVPALMYAFGVTQYCNQGDGNMALNPALYTGDKVTVTFAGVDSYGNLQCTCSGSACDVSISRAKKA